MSIRTSSILSCLLAFAAGCGDDDGGNGGPADAPPNVPPTITITGTATAREPTSSMPAADVAVEAFSNANESTPVATATTDANGMYTLTITTNGVPLDGYIKATKSGLVDTYLYPPAPLVENFDGASLNMLTPTTLETLSTFCQGNQDPAKGTIALLVYDAAEMPVGGATVTSSPAATKVCYNGSTGLPSNSATATAADGTAYLFNVTGNVTVSATATGATFKSHPVNARAGALTTTLVTP